MLISFAMVAIGLTLLAVGGDVLVRSSLSIARMAKISAFVSGIVVVGFGTSAPELLVSLDAAFRGRPNIAVGNVVGSNIANILLILGLSSFIAPLACSARVIKRDILVVFLASMFLLGWGFYGQLPRPAGMVMFILLLGYLIFVLRQVNTDHTAPVQPHLATSTDLPDHASPQRLWTMLMFIASVIMVALGADLLVDGAANIARAMGVSDAVIGLSLVAIGTSLPELAAAVMAATRKQTDLIMGNVLGSSVFNLLGILGLTALITPLPIAARMTAIDIPISIAVLVLIGLVAMLTPRLTRRYGVLLSLLYGGYVAALLA